MSKNLSNIEIRVKIWKKKLEKLIIIYILKNKSSYFAVFYHLFIISLIFGLGVWNIRNNLIDVSIGLPRKTDIWISIIKHSENVLIMLIAVAIILENISNRRNQNNLFEITSNIEKYIGVLNEETHFTLYAVFNGFLFCLSFLQLILEQSNRKYVQFLFSIVGQYYLLNSELHFITLVLKIRRYYRTLNKNLENKLRRTCILKFMWINNTNCKGKNYTAYIFILIYFMT